MRGRAIWGPAVAAVALGCARLAARDLSTLDRSAELAVGCRTDEALRLAEAAEREGGATATTARLAQVAILHDAGRSGEERALRARILREADGSLGARELDDATRDTVWGMREERQKRTGTATCREHAGA